MKDKGYQPQILKEKDDLVLVQFTQDTLTVWYSVGYWAQLDGA